MPENIARIFFCNFLWIQKAKMLQISPQLSYDHCTAYLFPRSPTPSVNESVSDSTSVPNKVAIRLEY